MEPSASELSLPPEMTQEQLAKVVNDYAPCLRFHRAEYNFPSDPDSFRKKSRFRESLSERDKGWNKQRARWEKKNEHDGCYYDVPWDSIVRESLARMMGSRHIDPPSSSNLRPRDDNNRYEKGSIHGLFLQRLQSQDEMSSGNAPSSNRDIEAPVFVDTHVDRIHDFVKVLYWFFYELNWWKCLFTHQGDWEHICLIFPLRDLNTAPAPTHIYFAQHNGGVVLPFDALKMEDKTHPIIFVDKDGHPCCPFVKDPFEYPIRWRAWHNDLVFIPRAEWRDYAGAWGEVGEFKFTTGPLGPFFKRHKDNVKIRIRDGKPYFIILKP